MDANSDSEHILNKIKSWSERKSDLFNERYVEIAKQQLSEYSSGEFQFAN
jgi:hypothetical protein